MIAEEQLRQRLRPKEIRETSDARRNARTKRLAVASLRVMHCQVSIHAPEWRSRFVLESQGVEQVDWCLVYFAGQ